MNLLKRLRNLWYLSAYRPLAKNEMIGKDTVNYLQKDTSLISRKMAKIVKESINYFEPEDDNTNK